MHVRGPAISDSRSARWRLVGVPLAAVLALSALLLSAQAVEADPTGTIYSEHGGESVDGQLFAQGQTYHFQTGVRGLDSDGHTLRLVADGTGPGGIGPAGEEVCEALFGPLQCADVIAALGTTLADGDTAVVKMDLTIAADAPAGEWTLRYFLVDDPFVPGAPAYTMASFTFYVVDEWAQIGGTIRSEPTELPGKQPTHVFDGFVGTAGDAGIVGSITVHYRDEGVSCTFTPGSGATFQLRTATGVGVTERLAATMTGFESTCDPSHSAQIQLLDKDATPQFPRGALTLRPFGSPSTDPLEIDATPGSTGADSWVSLEKGNIHVGGGD